jgi:uncharacterized membrane protein
LADLRLGQTAIKALLAAGAMAGLMAVALNFSNSLLGSTTLVAQLIAVVIPGAIGVAVYLGLVSLLRVEEVGLLHTQLRQRLRRPNLD